MDRFKCTYYNYHWLPLFNSFLSSLAKSKYLSLFPFSLIFNGPPERQSSLDGKFSIFFIRYKSGLKARIRWSVRISNSQRNLCISFSKTLSGFYMYHFVVWWNYSYHYFVPLRVFHTSVSRQFHQTWPIKWNAVSSRQQSYRYCCMDALLGR